MSLKKFISEQRKLIKKNDLEWREYSLESQSSARCKIEGKKKIMLCSNNYLGLSNHPQLRKAAIDAVKKYGAGSGSVRAIAGTMDLHKKLEEKIAKFKHAPASKYFNTGFTVGSGLIPQLATDKTLFISDQLNHGCIIDGVRLSKAEKAIYAHKNMGELEEVLRKHENKHDHILILTDGVFSMDGDVAPLPEIVKLAKKYGADTYVDDAHGDGVMGEQGRGTVNHFGLEGKITIDTGTFSKAFGTMGGFFVGSKELCDYAHNKTRTYLLTGSQPPATVAASTAAIDLLSKDKKIVPQLWKNTKYFKGALNDLGFNIGESVTPITPIMLGENKTAKKFSQEMIKEGVFALPIIFPMVAQGTARIRTMMTAEHTQKDLNDALKVIEKVGKKLKVI